MEKKRITLLEPEGGDKGLTAHDCLALVNACLKLRVAKDTTRRVLQGMKVDLIDEEAAGDAVEFFDGFFETPEMAALIRKGLGSYVRALKRKKVAATENGRRIRNSDLFS